MVNNLSPQIMPWGHRSRDRMVVGFTTTYAISSYHHWWWVRISIRARCTALCDKVCQWLSTGRWFSPGPPVSPTNRTDSHDITEILLKVVLNSIKQTNKSSRWKSISCLEAARRVNYFCVIPTSTSRWLDFQRQFGLLKILIIKNKK